MLENGQARDLADLARKFSLTRARVTQILNYTLLAPDIQREILALPPVEPGREPIREPAMRAVLREVLWTEQRTRRRVLRPQHVVSVHGAESEANCASYASEREPTNSFSRPPASS